MSTTILGAVSETRTVQELLHTRLGQAVVRANATVVQSVPGAQTAINTTSSILNWCLSKSISAPRIAAADQKICTLASQVSTRVTAVSTQVSSGVQAVQTQVVKAKADPLAFTFDAFDATIDYVLPDWEPVKEQEQQVAASPAPAAATPKPAAAETSSAVATTTTKKQVPRSTIILAAATSRALVLQKRLLQRLEAIVRYLSSTKLVSSYAARMPTIPSRAEATARLRGLVEHAVDTATELRKVVSTKQQAIIDDTTARLNALKTELGRNTLSVALIQRCANAVLQTHDYLVKALRDSATFNRIAENDMVKDSKWVAKVQTLDRVLTEALESVAHPVISLEDAAPAAEAVEPAETSTTTTLDRINGTLDSSVDDDDSLE